MLPMAYLSLLALGVALVDAEEDADSRNMAESGGAASFNKGSVAKVCPGPTKSCADIPRCADALTAALPEWGAGRDALKETWDSLGQNTDALGAFDKLSECYKTEMGKESLEIAKNIKCDWCGFLVEDIWQSTIGAGRLIDAKKKTTNDAKDAARIAREFMDELCDIEFIQVAPSKFDIQPYKGPNGENFRVIRDQVEDVRAAASAKAWQMDIYRQTCEEYMKTVEMDFVEAIVDGMEEGKTELDEFLYKYAQNSEEMKAAWQRLIGMSQNIKKVACAELCKVPKKRKSQYKKGAKYGRSGSKSEQQKIQEQSEYSEMEFAVEGVPDIKGIRKHLSESMGVPLEKITVRQGERGRVIVRAPKQESDIDVKELLDGKEPNAEQIKVLEKLKAMEDEEEDEAPVPSDEDKDEV